MPGRVPWVAVDGSQDLDGVRSRMGDDDVVTDFIARLFELPTWLSLSLVFLLPAAEASVFLGFVLPGEVAVVMGGVLAFQGRVPLTAALAAAISGAIAGDSVGYLVGRRWGRRILDSTLGRFIKAEHIDKGQVYLATKGGKAVFLGRWTASLRALIPGLAGMSSMPYRKFLLWNCIGGTAWATTFVLLGHAAGDGWRRIEHSANRAGLVILGLVICTAVTWLVVRKIRQRTTSVTDR